MSAVSLQCGQAGVPSTQDGRMVGKIAMRTAFQRGELLVTSSEARNECRMNEE
jgi:hypothetical protein